MLYVVVLLILLLTGILLFRLRLRIELSDTQRLLFLGIGRSGAQIDFAVGVTRIRLFGMTVRSISHDTSSQPDRVSTRLPSKSAKAREKTRRIAKPDIRERLETIMQTLSALWRFAVDLLHSVKVEEAEAEIQGGFESPHLTGQAFGYYHALIGAVPELAPRLRFCPDWTGASLAGSARLSLAIPLYVILHRTALTLLRLPLLRLVQIARRRKKGAAYAQ